MLWRRLILRGREALQAEGREQDGAKPKDRREDGNESDKVITS
jgi:hypothetical protein